MTADELLERSSSRLLTEYRLLYALKAQEAKHPPSEHGDDEARPVMDEDDAPTADDEDEVFADDLPEPPDPFDDLPTLEAEAKARLARALRGES